MAIDRDETLRKAEKLLRQGKLEAAIAEYARVVEDQPRDWTTANLLGDLFVRSGQIERAVGQYARIADNLAREGFVSKATALYKKIVKIHPEDDTALLRAAELAARQGLGADARGYLQALFQQRVRRNDRTGAAKIAVRIAELDPSDVVGRLEAARLLAELGESASAAEQLRGAGQALCGAGKAVEGIRAWREALRFNPADALTRSLMVQALIELGDPDAARTAAHQAGDLRAVADAFSRAGRDDDALRTLEQALAAEPDSEILRVAAAHAALQRGEYARAQDIIRPLADDPSPAVHLVRAEIDLRSGQLEQAGADLDRYLASAPDVSRRVEELAASVAKSDPDAAFAVIGALIRRGDATGDVEPAIGSLERLVSIVPTHIDALEQLVLICNDSFHQDQQYRARVQLADAYLACLRWAEARSVSEALVAQRPEHATHRDRLARALNGLGVPMPTAPAGQPPPAPVSHEQLDILPGLPARPRVEDPRLEIAPRPAVSDPLPPVASPFELDLAPMTPLTGRPGDDEPLELQLPQRDDRDTAPQLDARLEPVATPEVYEIDLSSELEALLAEAPALLPAGPEDPSNRAPQSEADDLELDGDVRQVRETSGKDEETAAAARAYDRASEHYNQGEHDAAVACLREAVRDVNHRFRASSMLARLARERGDLVQAIEWLERAAESPAPTLTASHALLYELADTLQASGDPDRALAVFLELHAEAPSYRDVARRIGESSWGTSGGGLPPEGPA